MASRLGNDLLETLTAMLNPLPAIALLPLALIWLGLGNPSIVFVLVHAVMWPIALNTHSGFLGVSGTMRMVGRNYGLSGVRYVSQILIPAAFPHILAGLKIGWAFAWRTLIAAELVFGTTSGSGGLGWFIYENKNLLDIPAVFSGLFTVIIIGLLVENLVFRIIERRTIRKWGMHS
jgi:NitT/TauT family transport system permease protein